MVLGEPFDLPASFKGKEEQAITYKRGTGKKVRPDDCVADEGLRFGPDVPMKTIRLPVLGIDGVDESEIEVIDVKTTYKLAQRPASYVVIAYETPVVKIRESGKVKQGAMLTPVLERSIADVSLLVGLLVDKFRFLLPLYRQHQRMQAAGVTVARSTLTNLVQRSIALLEPIVDAQLESVLRSRILAMDWASPTRRPLRLASPKSRRHAEK